MRARAYAARAKDKPSSLLEKFKHVRLERVIDGLNADTGSAIACVSDALRTCAHAHTRTAKEKRERKVIEPLRHGEHINNTNGVFVKEVAKKKSHDLKRHTGAA